MNKIVAVAGTNAMKVAGTRKGLEALLFAGILDAALGVRGVVVPDCPFVPPQPFGFRQTRRGALYRAQQSLLADPEATFGYGLENGILLLDEEHPHLGGVDVPVGCIVSRDGCVTYGTGPGVHVEGEYIVASLATAQQTTCGKLIAPKTGFDHANWHKDYMGGAGNREETLITTTYVTFAVHFARH
jgi:non-canonical (house-cleaning) NTP pyrophosphatase